MKVFLVGGCVRDELLGLPVQDRDWVVVDGSREDMLKRGFEQVGADFPVFLHPRTKEEYALARTERKVGTGYLGFDVSTEGVTLEQDLARRDLTINAMARDTDGNLIDPFNGQRDLKDKVLRHVSDAFMEDPLRVVRLARFYARYTDFCIAAETVAMAQQVVLSGEMNSISSERYWAELLKVMKKGQGDPARFFDALQLFGAFNHVEFFRSVFGNRPTSVLVAAHAGQVARKAQELYDADKALLVLIAGSANLWIDPKYRTVSTDVFAAREAVLMYAQIDPTRADNVLMLVKKLRAVTKDTDVLVNMVDTLRLLNSINVFIGMPVDKFVKLVKVVQAVPVGPFLDAGLTGKAIGDALDVARLDALQRAMKG